MITGGTVTRGKRLYFETESKIEGARYIFVVDANDGVRPIMPPPGHIPAWKKAGRLSAESGSDWVVFDLDSYVGQIRLVAAVSRDTLPLEPDIIDAWRKNPAGTPWISFDTVEIDVTQWAPIDYAR